MSTSSHDEETSNVSEVTETGYETESEEEIDPWTLKRSKEIISISRITAEGLTKKLRNRNRFTCSANNSKRTRKSVSGTSCVDKSL